MPHVIILDNISPQGLSVLNACAGVEYSIRTGLAGDELRQALSEADGAICRSGVQITAESLSDNHRLRAIVRAGVGTDNIDKTAATRHGIVVMNTPAGNTLSTAEHAFALMLGLSRNLAPAYQSLVNGKWDRKLYMGSQLADKTLGVIGLGRIGQEVAKRAVAFKMCVLGYDPFLSSERAAELGIELIEDVDQLFPRVDYLTVHTPLTPATTNLIDTPQINATRTGVRLINCARGGIYNEAALVEGLRAGKLGGVALDVFESEPNTDSPLFGMPGVLCTPHLGASTEEAQTQVAVEAAQLLVNYLSRGEVRHAVNMVSIDPKALASVRSYLQVAYRLGLLLGQWRTSGTDSCKLRYWGDVSRKDTRLLTAAFCAGLLEPVLDQDVNIVNSEMLVRERGIRLTEETTDEKGAFSSSITATLISGDTEIRVAGTVFGESMPRLVQLGNYRLEAYLDGILLIFFHNDVPGIIGAVGTIFGSHGVNIAQMTVGRAQDKPGSKAIAVLNLDSAPSDPAMRQVLRIPGINDA
ncbi:MAG: phosphoglycerate dehydrogenase, partial [Sedimenticolaceae bacterium]